MADVLQKLQWFVYVALQTLILRTAVLLEGLQMGGE